MKAEGCGRISIEISKCGGRIFKTENIITFIGSTYKSQKKIIYSFKMDYRPKFKSINYKVSRRI